MKTPRISQAEWEVMEAIWEKHPATALDIVERLSGRRDWKEQTIRTLLGRLVRKGALLYDVEGKKYLYRPAFRREQMMRAESQTFLNRVMRGIAAPVLVQLIDEAALSRQDIEELRALLKKKQPRKPNL